jgi:hypothetical protein
LILPYADNSGDDYYSDDTLVVVTDDAKVVITDDATKIPSGNVCCEYEPKCGGPAGGMGYRNLAAATTGPTTPTSAPVVASKESDDYMKYDDDSCEYVCLKYASHADKC